MRHTLVVPLAVIPAQAGIHPPATHWIPAYAGMTGEEASSRITGGELAARCTSVHVLHDWGLFASCYGYVNGHWHAYDFPRSLGSVHGDGNYAHLSRA